MTTGSPAEIDAALDRLHFAIDRLEALLPNEPQRAEIDALRRSASRLGEAPRNSADAARPHLRLFEPARFERLLQLAGPQNGEELLARLAEDLGTTLKRSETAFAVMDWNELRGASHVLISLAGSVGAVSLQELAEVINGSAHDKDGARLERAMPDALRELSALIEIVAATRPIGRSAK